MKAFAIVVAAGAGVRMGGDTPKAFLDVDGEPMFVRSLRTLASLRGGSLGVVLVAPPGWEDRAREQCAREECAREQCAREERRGGDMPSVTVVGGGETRQASVRAGLRAVPEGTEAVVVHDAARPFAEGSLFEAVLSALGEAKGAICAVPVHDTLKRARGNGVIETVAREGLWRAQTPQAFRAQVLRDAHERAAREGVEFSDDAGLVEWAGGRVVIVPGDERNEKITTPQHLATARIATAFSMPAGATRAGSGFDAHAFIDGRPLVIGGVTIPWHRGLDGHSDADVLSHAIADALLGAAGAGDLGAHFPSTDERWRDVSSAVLLSRVAEIVRSGGLAIEWIDATVVLQEPSLAPHWDAIRACIAATLRVDEARVHIKATTTDRLGIVGRGEGAAAQAIAVLARAPDRPPPPA